MGVNHLGKWSSADPSNGATELPGHAPDKFHQPQKGGDMRPKGVHVNPTMPKVEAVQRFGKKALHPSVKATPHPHGGARAGSRHVPNSRQSGKAMGGPNFGRPASGGTMK